MKLKSLAFAMLLSLTALAVVAIVNKRETQKSQPPTKPGQQPPSSSASTPPSLKDLLKSLPKALQPHCQPPTITAELSDALDQFKGIPPYAQFGQSGRKLLKTLRSQTLLKSDREHAQSLINENADQFETAILDLKLALKTQNPRLPEDSIPNRTIRIISEKLRVKAYWFAHNAQPQTAIDQLATLISILTDLRRLSVHLDAREACNDAISEACNELRRLASWLKPNTDVNLNQIRKQLKASEVTTNEIQQCLGTQFVIRHHDLTLLTTDQQQYILDWPTNSASTTSSDADQPNPDHSNNLSKPMSRTAHYSAQVTTQWFLKLFRLTNNALTSTDSYDKLKNYGEGIDEEQRPWRKQKANALGQLFLDRLYMDLFSNLSIQRRLIIAKLRLTEIVLAAQQHRLSFGKLPSNEAEIQKTLPKGLPIDPYTNEPLIFNAKANITYTVGPNQIDNDGALDDYFMRLTHTP